MNRYPSLPWAALEVGQEINPFLDISSKNALDQEVLTDKAPSDESASHQSTLTSA